MEKIFVGKRIREIRRYRKYSLQKLSNLSQCSVNYLSKLERGLNSPTIETLIKITEALGIQLTDFFTGKELSNSSMVIRKKERKSFSKELAGITYEMLSSFEGHALFDAFLITLKPGASIGDMAHERRGNELLYVLSGRLNFTIGEMSYELFSHDCISFDPGDLHRLKNNHSTPIKVISISAPPRY